MVENLIRIELCAKAFVRVGMATANFLCESGSCVAVRCARPLPLCPLQYHRADAIPFTFPSCPFTFAIFPSPFFCAFRIPAEEEIVKRLLMIEKMPTRLFTVQEAARYLAVSASTLYGWVWQRRISFVKVGRALRFDVRDLEKFVDENREAARSDNIGLK
jgi:excisionase family DNA binding protein